MGAQELGHGTEPSAGAYVVESVHSCSRGCMGAAVFNPAAKVTLEHSTAGKEEAYSWGAFLIRGLEGTKALGLPGRKGGSGAFSGAGNGEGRRDGVRGFKPVAGFQSLGRSRGRLWLRDCALGGPWSSWSLGCLQGGNQRWSQWRGCRAREEVTVLARGASRLAGKAQAGHCLNFEDAPDLLWVFMWVWGTQPRACAPGVGGPH